MKQLAFAYLRVSGLGQVSGDGFVRQLTAIQSYAEANGLEIARVFREEGVSGTVEQTHRPAFCAMLEALQADSVSVVIIENVSRLARDLMVQEAAIADMQKRGIQLISVAEPDLLGSDPTRVLLRQLVGAISQWEKSTIVAKLRGARQRQKAKLGRCEGRKPYGTRDGEVQAIVRAKQLRAEGRSLAAIADTLGAEGYKPRAAVRWYPMTVKLILESQVNA